MKVRNHMKVLAKAQTVEWFGLYRTYKSTSMVSRLLGDIRKLEGVYATYTAAKLAKDNMIVNDSNLDENSFMIETVQVKMQAWKI